MNLDKLPKNMFGGIILAFSVNFIMILTLIEMYPISRLG